MIELFPDEVRRNPFALYEHMRSASPLFYEASSGLWMVFDYATVKEVLSDHETFSSKNNPADWLIFVDPPRHRQLRALVSQAFTPRSIVNLESRITQLVKQLLDPLVERGTMDVAEDLAIPLPLMVIAEMLGIPPEDRKRFAEWNDAILKMSYAIGDRSDRAKAIYQRFMEVTAQMNDYLTYALQQRRAQPKDDLLTRLLQAELEGQRLTQQDILGFFQPLLLAGSETTTILINNAIICFAEHPDQLALLRRNMDLLPSAIEEVLRYRTPFQWMFRITTRPVELHGQQIPAGKMVLAVMGSANHDPAQFANPEVFDIQRNPNPHLAFGIGAHFCLGSPLARLEGKIALKAMLDQMDEIELTGPWEPRQALHLHGPVKLPITFKPRQRLEVGVGT